MNAKAVSDQPVANARYDVRVIDNGKWESKAVFPNNYYVEALKELLKYKDAPVAYVLDHQTGKRHTVETAESLVSNLPG